MHDSTEQHEQQRDVSEGIEITQNEGFLCHIRMITKIDLPPEKAFHIISDPDNARLFRSIEECTHRRVIFDDGRGKKRVEVDHSSGWRFLWRRGTFTTSLLVEQDDDARVMAFRLRKPGFMKNFEGFWRMESYPGQPEATLGVLHQNIMPFLTAPGLNWVLTKICKGQIEAMLEDVQGEVRRINKGDPIPEHQRKKMEGKRSWADPVVKGFQLDFDSGSEDGSPRAAAAPATSAQNLPEAPDEAAASAPKQQVHVWELLEAAERNMITPSPDKADDGSAPPPPLDLDDLKTSGK